MRTPNGVYVLVLLGDTTWERRIQHYVNPKMRYIDSSGWHDLGTEDSALCGPKMGYMYWFFWVTRLGNRGSSTKMGYISSNGMFKLGVQALGYLMVIIHHS